MPGLMIPADGLKLSVLPRPSDPHKRDRIAQAAEFELPESITLKKIEELGQGKVHASLAGLNPHIQLGSRKFNVDLQVLENGYLYRSEEGAKEASLKARLDIKLPEKAVGADSGMLKLMQGLATVKAEKRSAEAAEIGLAIVKTDGKRRKIDPTAHRRGLFGRANDSRSATGSPSMFPSVPRISVTSEDPIKKAKQEAIRVALVHLVAVREVSKDYIVRTLKCSPSDIQQLLSRHCAPGLAPNKFKLNPKAFRLLDPYGFDYSDEDRKEVIEKAIEMFDRMRLGPEEKDWQKLLPKEERGKGTCLSRLQKQREAVVDEKAAAREARTAPEGSLTVDSERANNSHDVSGDSGLTPRPGSRHGSSRASIAGSRPGSPALSRPGSSGSMFSQHEGKTQAGPSTAAEKRKQNAAKLDKAPGDVKRQKTEVSKTSSNSLSPHPATQAKSNVKKPADKKSVQPTASKIKSAEFITESDEEEAEAATQVTAVSPQPAPKKESSEKREPAKQAKLVAPAPKPVDSALVAKKLAERQPARTTDKLVPVESVTAKLASKSSTTNSLSRPTARPAALDKAKLEAKPIVPRTASRPPTPQSATMPLSSANAAARKPLQKKTVIKTVPASTASPRVAASRSSAATPAKTTAKEDIKPAAKLLEKKTASKPADSRDASQKPAPKRDPNVPPKRDPNVPPKRFEPEKKSEPVKKLTTGEAKSKAAAPKAVTPAAAKGDKTRNATQSKPTAGSASARAAETNKAPAMQKTFSHQRKSSSPIKPSPLASSPPISASDMDEVRGSTKTSTANTPLRRTAGSAAPKPTLKIVRREAPTSQPKSSAKTSTEPERALKRKANDADSSSTPGAAASGSIERPAKRRDTGAATAARSNGASGSTATSSKPARAEASNAALKNNNLKAKPDDRADSHSPSPASSTIGSTSTKGTSASLMSNAGSTNKESSGKGKQLAKDGEKTGASIKGFKQTDLQRAQKFEEEMEKYNKLQRQVALMDNPPTEKVRELNAMFSQLERQKKTFAFIAGCE